MFNKVFIGIALCMTLAFSSATFAGQPYIEPPSIEQMIDELNNDPIIHDNLGFVFEQDGPILIFHTGKSFADISANWMKYGKLTQMISNNWKAVSGSGLVVGIDIESKIAFATDNNCAFHMAQTPKDTNPKREI